MATAHPNPRVFYVAGTGTFEKGFKSNQAKYHPIDPINLSSDQGCFRRVGLQFESPLEAMILCDSEIELLSNENCSHNSYYHWRHFTSDDLSVM